jgi:hypothetical protein
MADSSTTKRNLPSEEDRPPKRAYKKRKKDASQKNIESVDEESPEDDAHETRMSMFRDKFLKPRGSEVLWMITKSVSSFIRFMQCTKDLFFQCNLHFLDNQLNIVAVHGTKACIVHAVFRFDEAYTPDSFTAVGINVKGICDFLSNLRDAYDVLRVSFTRDCKLHISLLTDGMVVNKVIPTVDTQMESIPSTPFLTQCHVVQFKTATMKPMIKTLHSVDRIIRIQLVHLLLEDGEMEYELVISVHTQNECCDWKFHSTGADTMSVLVVDRGEVTGNFPWNTPTKESPRVILHNQIYASDFFEMFLKNGRMPAMIHMYLPYENTTTHDNSCVLPIYLEYAFEGASDKIPQGFVRYVIAPCLAEDSED